MPLILYQRDECHLCDLAVTELAKAGAGDFESVFIDDEPDLVQRYGLRVPVLAGLPGGAELDWPFDGAAIAAALGS